MGKPQKHYPKWKKPDAKDYINIFVCGIGDQVLEIFRKSISLEKESG
jgi:hypothetical protein